MERENYLSRAKSNQPKKKLCVKGLKDKNGKEIYEGDIVERFDQKERSDVVWNEQDGGFWLRRLENRLLWTHLPVDMSLNWVVIGNIYENPDLIKNRL